MEDKKPVKQVDYKELLKQEYIKCVKDPAYFMKRYVYIQHPQRGRILFNLYPFQEKVLHLFRDNENIIVLKSRQLGISTLAAGYALWLLTFFKDKNVLCLATTQATARNLVKKVIFAYEQLPKWLQVPYKSKNKLSMELRNGSKIEAKSSNSDAARSEAVSLLLVDECAFIDNIEETFAAAQMTLATGGQAMLLSTPNGMGNFFHKTWVKAELGENSFTPVLLPWTVHPERDQSWRDKQDADLGPRLAAQECDASFLTSGDGVFEPEDLKYYEDNFCKDPLERRGVDNNLWIWEYPDYNRTYMVSADVARGDGSDYSAFQVWDVEACAQVAEYKGQLTPRDFGATLCGIATEYNNALLVVENASVGWAAIEEIQARSYPNLYYSVVGSGKNETAESFMRKMETGKTVPGFTITVSNRPLLISKLYDFIHQKAIILRSKRLLEELRVFIWHSNGKAAAANGYHDDLTLSAAEGLFVRDTALRNKSMGIDATRAALGGFVNLNQRNPVAETRPAFIQNPYQIQNPYGQTEDITWVL